MSAVRHFINLAFLIGLLQASTWIPSDAFEVAPSLERAADFICPQDEGFFSADNLCTEVYYLCSNGTAFEQICPDGSVFDPMIGTCADYEMASCRTTTPPSTSTTTIRTTTMTPFVCPTSDGQYPVPGKCGSEYYICVTGIPTLTSCPSGEVFDPIYYDCAPAEEATCNLPFECPSSDGFYTYPGACSSMYFICLQDIGYISYCPPGSVFDPAIPACAVIENASCIPGPPILETTTEGPTSPAPFVCPGDGRYPVEGNCTVYWICSGGNSFIAPCPVGLVYNPNTKICDFPANNDTTNCITYRFFGDVQMEDMLIGTDSDFVCPSLGSWPHPDLCELYYTCYYQEPPYLWQCRQTFLYDQNQKECISAELVDCGDRVSPSIYFAVTSSSPDCSSSPDGFYPESPDSCINSYYACVQGVYYSLVCPGENVFDPVTGTCVNPDVASCSVTTIAN